MEVLNSLRLSDDSRYRPILEMDSVPESYRKGGVGGIERFSDLKGYENSDLLVSFRTKIEEIKNMANVQDESFKAIGDESQWNGNGRWIIIPAISPVSVEFPAWRRVYVQGNSSCSWNTTHA